MSDICVNTEDIITWRRHIHQHPELSFKEVETSRFIADLLTQWGIDVKHPTPTSVVGTLVGTKPTEPGQALKHVALRADIDALPLQEKTGEPFQSVNDGVAHACGHDAHAAMLLGAAQALSRMTSEFAGTITFIFQHAEEENPGGAIELVRKGVLEGVDAIFGIHVMNQKLGTVDVHKGAASTIAGGFFCTIQGQGSHGSMPQNSIDPLLVGAEIALILNTIVGRNVDPSHMNIVNVGSFQCGEAPNVIPDTARLGVSLRSDSNEQYKVLCDHATGIVTNLCEANGATVDYEWVDAYPVVMNNEALCDIAFAAAQKIVGEGAYYGDATSASEDFAYYAAEIPGCFLFLGAGTADDGLPFMNHHPKFNINEECLPIGAKLHCQVALDFLAG